jgi:hypothetical protein
MCTENDRNIATQKMQPALNILESWGLYRNMKINASKTQAIMFSKTARTASPDCALPRKGNARDSGNPTSAIQLGS